MAVNPSFRAFVLEQLGRAVAGVRARNMFGGAGIYAGDVCFGLLAQDTLYFRVGDETRGDFEARGMEPFRPFGEDHAKMPYYRVPEDLLEDPDALRPWAEAALGVARQRKAARSGKSVQGSRKKAASSKRQSTKAASRKRRSKNAASDKRRPKKAASKRPASKNAPSKKAAPKRARSKGSAR